MISGLGVAIRDPSKIALASDPTVGESDNRNAQAMFGLQEKKTIEGKKTFNDAYASMVSDVGSKTNTLKTSSATQEKVVNQLMAQQQSISGVNLDEQYGNGRYIFAGYKTDTPPFVDGAGGVSYVGGTDNITQYVDTSREMIIGHTGNSVFDRISGNPVPEPNSGTSETNVFTMLDTAIDALNTPAEQLSEANNQLLRDVVDKSSRGLKNSLNNILTVRAELGTQLQELENLDDNGKDRELH